MTRCLAPRTLALEEPARCIEFFVEGLPSRGGAWRTRSWRGTAAAGALEALGDGAPIDGPLAISCRFITDPSDRRGDDLGRLLRTVEQALSHGILWWSPRQLLGVSARRVIGPVTGVHVVARVLEPAVSPVIRAGRHGL